MQYITEIDSYQSKHSSAVTLGKFDGLHRGHQKLIDKIREYASDDVKSIVCAFDMGKESLLTGEERKERLSSQVDCLIACPFTKEIREMEGTYQVGDKISADLFELGDVVDVTGTSKGKGFAGTIKRHGQSRGPMAHGSHYHRGPGSLGTMLPKRVLKGKNLPGHMGCETVTVQNLEIIEANTAENYILVSGNIPGAKNSLVLIRSAVKNSRKKNPKEIVSYEEEPVVDEVVETNEVETTENETQVES